MAMKLLKLSLAATIAVIIANRVPLVSQLTGPGA